MNKIKEEILRLGCRIPSERGSNKQRELRDRRDRLIAVDSGQANVHSSFSNVMCIPEPVKSVVVSGESLERDKRTYEFQRDGNSFVTTDLTANGDARVTFESWEYVCLYLVRLSLKNLEYLEF